MLNQQQVTMFKLRYHRRRYQKKAVLVCKVGGQQGKRADGGAHKNKAQSGPHSAFGMVLPKHKFGVRKMCILPESRKVFLVTQPHQERQLGCFCPQFTVCVWTTLGDPFWRLGTARRQTQPPRPISPRKALANGIPHRNH